MENDYYGAPGASDSKNLKERLRERYDEQDWVRVINIDTHPVTYQYTTPTDLDTHSDHPGHKDTIMRRPPKRVTLEPGEQKVCAAFEADRMIEDLIKQMSQRDTQDKIDSGQRRPGTSANWTDPTTQEIYIKEIFLGKEDVLQAFNEAKPESTIEADLNIEDKPVVRRGRPAKTV